MGCRATSLGDEKDGSVVAVIVGDKDDAVDNSGVERQSAVLLQAVTTAL